MSGIGMAISEQACKLEPNQNPPTIVLYSGNKYVQSIEWLLWQGDHLTFFLITFISDVALFKRMAK